MKRKKGSIVELDIETLVFGGRGIGRLEDGYKVFVPDVAPGDRVRAKLLKIKKNYAEARLEEVVKSSPNRVAARCKHFDTCGGCRFQFLPYEEQLLLKKQQTLDALERLGGLDASVMRDIIGCEDPWFYRNKMELSFGPGDSPMLGLYPPGYHYEVFDLEECFLQSELVADIAHRVREFAKQYELPVYRSDMHEGLLRNLMIREGKNTGEVMVDLVTSTEPFDYKDEFVALFDERVTSLYWSTVYQVPGQPTWREDLLLAGKATLTESLILESGQRLEFDILPQAFFQTNTRQAQVLYSKVVELAGLSGEETVFDLYCGTGTIGLFCAHKAKQVVGVEVNEAAVESARGNAQRNGIRNASFYLGSVEKRLASLTASPDVVIVDPPRSGLGEKVVEQVAAFEAPKIVYVSCNPTTLARDLKQFAALGYATRSVQPVDMFPQTAHVECVCLLEQVNPA